MDFENLDEELELAIEAVFAAGEEIMDLYEQEFEYAQKADGSLVSEADVISNEVIKAILIDSNKNKYGFMSEETDDDLSRFDHDRVWVLDPLDGSKHFIDMTDDFTIQLALLVKNELELAVVYAPAHDVMFFAKKGEGAYMISGDSDPVKISVSDIKDLTKSRLLVSESRRQEEVRNIGSSLGIEIVPVGSGLKYCLIGRGDGEIVMNLSGEQREWDVAAPALILQEAGGFVCDKEGNPLIWNKENTKMNNGIIGINNRVNLDKIISEIKKLN